MRIVSWNVNGIRSLGKNGYWKGVWALKPDILCLQETKAEAEQIPDEIREVSGFHSFFNSSKMRKGYSGVALFSREMPEKVEYDMGGEERFDVEGRMITAVFKDFTLVNVYIPNGGRGPERLAYKMDYYDALLVHLERLRTEYQRPVIFCGDLNVAHEAIDLARPEANQETTGFLPEERAWMDEVLANGFVDVFRERNPERTGAYTYWDQISHARDRNVGWRIDYFIVDSGAVPKVQSAGIHADIFGSDHCPISLDLS